jgi:multidrug efflux pump
VVGIDGQFYKQFALTIAASTVISAINSLTLSPALAAVLLKGHEEKPDILTRFLDRTLGWLFRGFNRVFLAGSHRYGTSIAKVLRLGTIVILIYGGMLVLAVLAFRAVPTGFIPAQDKAYLVTVVQLPEAASLERTDAVARRVSQMIKEVPGVNYSVGFPGLSVVTFSPASNQATIFIGLKDFSSRLSEGLTADRIANQVRQKIAGVQEAFVAVFPPPPILGLGSLGGFKLQVQDRGNEGLEALNAAVGKMIGAGNQTAGLAGVFSTFQMNVPQVYVDIDKVKAKTQGIALNDVFETLQIYLGSLYVNDLNLFGRTYQVNAQADARFRLHPEDIGRLKTRNSQGEMLPLASVVKVSEITGPDRVVRYNMFPAIEINGAAAPGFSSGQAIKTVEALAKKELPLTMSFEWTELTFLQILAGSTAIYIFALSVLLVFLVLAALYESWTLPLAIILIVPMTILCAMGGVWVTRGDNNIFTQVALLVLVGLACKNAILIVEFAKYREDEGMNRFRAAIEACKLRLRPILMTSFAFIMGVVPLIIATGAGAEMRRALGTPVFFGMLGVTMFGLFLTPVFYVLLRGWFGRSKESERLPLPGPQVPLEGGRP